MKKIIKLVIFLAVVSALSGLCLGYLNNVTSPIIANNEMGAEKETLALMYPDAEFSILNAEGVGEEEKVTKAFISTEGQYVFKCQAKGYDDYIVILVGMDSDGTIDKISVLDQKETPSVGGKYLQEDKLSEMFYGKTINDEIDFKAGVTYTTKAVKVMLEACQDVYTSVQ